MTRNFYSENYESGLIRGEEDPRPWELHDEIRSVIHADHLLVDVGCGTAFKTIKLSPFVRRTVGVEPSARMRRRALANVAAAGVQNMNLVGGIAERLPFRDSSFDVATSMLSPPHAKELSRVLVPGGYVIVENIGERDKHNLKVEFGSDNDGPRGRYTAWGDGERIRYFEEEFSPYFDSVAIREGYWPTYYSMDGLRLLLEQTPTVRGFDRDRDSAALDRIASKYSTSRGIQTLQHRLLIIARK